MTCFVSVNAACQRHCRIGKSVKKDGADLRSDPLLACYRRLGLETILTWGYGACSNARSLEWWRGGNGGVLDRRRLGGIGLHSALGHGVDGGLLPDTPGKTLPKTDAWRGGISRPENGKGWRASTGSLYGRFTYNLAVSFFRIREVGFILVTKRVSRNLRQGLRPWKQRLKA